jgi:hypothetical protein
MKKVQADLTNRLDIYKYRLALIVSEFIDGEIL